MSFVLRAAVNRCCCIKPTTTTIVSPYVMNTSITQHTSLQRRAFITELTSSTKKIATLQVYNYQSIYQQLQQQQQRQKSSPLLSSLLSQRHQQQQQRRNCCSSLFVEPPQKCISSSSICDSIIRNAFRRQQSQQLLLSQQYRMKHTLKTNKSVSKRFNIRGSKKRGKKITLTHMCSGAQHNTGYRPRAAINKLGQSKPIKNKKQERKMKLCLGVL